MALARASPGAHPAGLWRTDYAADNGASPLFYVPLSGSCAANRLANDGGSCIDATDGNSWKAKFPSGQIDVRQFGAKPDNATPADAAVAAAIAFAGSIHACAYIPSIGPGYTFNNPITLSGSSNCLVGDRIQNEPFDGPQRFGTPLLHFPNDTDGIVLSTAGQGFYVANLSIIGNAAGSSAPTHTHGLFLNGTYDGVVEKLYIENFVVCRQYTAPSGRVSFANVTCYDKRAYPNIVNDYPYAGFEMDVGKDGSAVGGLQDIGGELAAQPEDFNNTFTGDGSNTAFQICAPLAQGSQSGFTVGCTGRAPFAQSSYLWAADGIKVRVGPSQIYPNRQSSNNAPLKTCGLPSQVEPYDYTIFDISAGGGGGAGGALLFCTTTSATLVKGSTTVVVRSTAGYRGGNDILAVADHGIPLAAKVLSIPDATHLVLSKPATQSGSANLTLTQIAVGTSGVPGFNQTCQAKNSCGYKMEVRFKEPPSAGTQVMLQWIDPTGYAAYDAEAVSDYLYLKPTFVGGYRVGLKHVGLSYGGIEFRPTYIEILNQCASIEAQTFGDVLIFHRIVNDPIPDCPGYIDPQAGPTIAAFNNSYRYYNGASNGGAGDR